MEIIKLQINPKHITSVTNVQRKWGDVRKQAAEKPLFIVSNNEIELVLLSYEEYTKLHRESKENK